MLELDFIFTIYMCEDWVRPLVSCVQEHADFEIPEPEPELPVSQDVASKKAGHWTIPV